MARRIREALETIMQGAALEGGNPDVGREAGFFNTDEIEQLRDGNAAEDETTVPDEEGVGGSSGSG